MIKTEKIFVKIYIQYYLYPFTEENTDLIC